MKAVLIKTTGASVEVHTVKRKFTFEELYHLLKTQTIEVVDLDSKLVMVVDEEAKMRVVKPPYNDVATALIRKTGRQGVILGDALVCRRGDLD
jgi:hypothetical protein